MVQLLKSFCLAHTILCSLNKEIDAHERAAKELAEGWAQAKGQADEANIRKEQAWDAAKEAGSKADRCVLSRFA